MKLNETSLRNAWPAALNAEATETQRRGAFLKGWAACRFCLSGLLSLFCLFSLRADLVHVIEQSEIEGEIAQISKTALETGASYATATPPTKSGYIFTHWTSNQNDPLTARDAWGRAKENADYTLYQAVTLTAHYLPASQDSDEDGIADGYELYWYGDLDENAASDTDGDGATFAEEIAAGTNPLFADSVAPGGIAWANGVTMLYNPSNYAPYVVRSVPEGQLFATTTNYLAPGSVAQSQTLSSTTTTFAYWTVGGTRIADAWGRASDSVAIAPNATSVLDVVAYAYDDYATQQSWYWYGRADVAQDSDTDGDGLTFAQELAAGTNPLFADAVAPGGIAWANGDVHEVNLQPFDQATGAVVGDKFEQIFTSSYADNGATSATFGANARPYVCDVNGDGLFDLVVISFGIADGAAIGQTTNVYLNVGGEGNPQFVLGMADEGIAEGLAISKTGAAAGMEGLILDSSTNLLAGVTVDVAPQGAVSVAFGDVDQDGVQDLLVSDEEGRIWFYKGTKTTTETSVPETEGTATETISYTLQHKVWAGTYEGFAKGLAIALVDWDGDGDLDCIGGTADGKLILLRDPRAGRPTNVRAEAGLDSVLLTWNLNGDSRVRGYRIYRTASEDGTFALRAGSDLPSYRDLVSEQGDYWYRVTSLTRFYRTGNSTPEESESLPTDAVKTKVGSVALSVCDSAAFEGGEAEVFVSVENSMGLSGKGLSLGVAYDATKLTVKTVATTGLSDALGGVSWNDDQAGNLTITSSSGEVAAGAGKLFAITFVAGEDAAGTATVSVTSATLAATSGATASVELPVSGSVVIEEFDPPTETEEPEEEPEDDVDPEKYEYSVANIVLGTGKGATGDEVEIPLWIRPWKDVTFVGFVAKIDYDERCVEPVGVTGLKGEFTFAATNGVLTIRGVSGTLAANRSGLLSAEKFEVLKIRFRICEQYAMRLTALTFETGSDAITLPLAEGNGRALTPVRVAGAIALSFKRPKNDKTIVPPGSRGDYDGDGRLTERDKRRMEDDLNRGRDFGIAEGSAISKTDAAAGKEGAGSRSGDYNGNGRIDEGDLHLMRKDFRERGVR